MSSEYSDRELLQKLFHYWDENMYDEDFVDHIIQLMDGPVRMNLEGRTGSSQDLYPTRRQHECDETCVRGSEDE